MLTNLSIDNYALIDSLEVSLEAGFTIITGETGAGKSIFLGGLSLVLGKRADLSSLRDKERKCIIEAYFQIKDYGLKSFFEENDLDYEDSTVIRREILPSGKSRAFINDSPVTLDVLTQLGDRLIDIHSQHQTLRLTENDFQLKLIDALANNTGRLSDFRRTLSKYSATKKELNELQEFQNNALKEQDYNDFLLTELEAAPLKEGILEELEEQYEQLNNVELIMEELSKGEQLMNDEQVGLLPLFSELKATLSRLSGFGKQYENLHERIKSVFIEMDDINTELQGFQDGVESNPALLEETNAKLQLLYNLQKKHGVSEISELIQIREELSQKAFETAHVDEKISIKTRELQDLESSLEEQALVLREKRNAVIPDLKKQLELDLSHLGMPSASFNIRLNSVDSFKTNGMDDLSFLFTANKGSDYGELKKVASGGELSRIMLIIKAILAKYEKLPTIMFDEIDTGVSGEISNRMADIMKEMSKDMQVFAITHLPQVASKGNHHFKVFKTDEPEGTRTNMRQLSNDERVLELAQMLGGNDVSDSALAHARQLLN
ncbi:DNA repair protein RecN [Maribacter cobaltidurans]|uniref:DNA repair protein RecN n=1 Tax=Maribacter cobaltidurans TaxID=1178778 RepID=A0A223V9P1_9FLAO|nr:DNA repair protein RecN [Maribacter cobaltidurans]ASV31987.1 DNA repair protein RecN [Maribacter cobaltidurans]GGD86253.1 DNA repair protein RecN [Maribacter cobaltidurans]